VDHWFVDLGTWKVWHEPGNPSGVGVGGTRGEVPGLVRAGGAGLGLSIVKTFAEAHGGRVWVEPGAGKGARFGVVLPVEKPG